MKGSNAVVKYQTQSLYLKTHSCKVGASQDHLQQSLIWKESNFAFITLLTVCGGWEGINFFCLIHQLFQVPLEKEGQLGGPILAQEEIKTIFGSIPDILDVHIKIKVSSWFSLSGEALIQTWNVFFML